MQKSFSAKLLLTALLTVSLLSPNAFAEKWENLIDQAKEISLSGDKQASEKIYNLGVAEAKKKGEASDAYRMALQELATFYEDENRNDEALTVYEKIIEICQLTNSAEIVSYLELSADVYCKQGNMKEARDRYERSIAIQEKNVGPDHPEIGKSLRDLARCYVSQNDYKEATALYQRMIDIQAKAKGDQDISMVIPLIEMANFYRKQQLNADAGQHYRKALVIFETFKKKNPKDTRVGILEELTIPELKKNIAELGQ